MSTCERNYYLLPAEKCQHAIALYLVARRDALVAKHDILIGKYGAQLLVREGARGVALGYSDIPSMDGVGAPESHESGWMVVPDPDTPIGREIQADIDFVAEQMEIRLWSIERALEVYGMRASGGVYYMANAMPLADGRVLVSAPAIDDDGSVDHEQVGVPFCRVPEWFGGYLISEVASRQIAAAVPSLDVYLQQQESVP